MAAQNLVKWKTRRNKDIILRLHAKTVFRAVSGPEVHDTAHVLEIVVTKPSHTRRGSLSIETAKLESVLDL